MWQLCDTQGGTIPCVRIWESVVWLLDTAILIRVEWLRSSFLWIKCALMRIECAFSAHCGQALRSHWTRQIEKIRPDWSSHCQHSCVCGAHTSQDFVQKMLSVLKNGGIKMKQMLKPKAITYHTKHFLRPYQIVHLLQQREDALHSRMVNVLVWATLMDEPSAGLCEATTIAQD